MMRQDGCKVCRVLSERDFEHYDERLLSEWRGDTDQRKGYRQLAEWLNVTLLRREMDKVGLSTLGDEARSKYERLRGDDARASEVANMLSREGIDVEQLRSDFVSYGVVRTHITECLGAEYEPEESGEWESDSIEIARDHAEGKIGEAVQSLVHKGKLDAGGDTSVHVAVELECDECHTRVPLERVKRRGYLCNCTATQEVAVSDD
jgi:hypothetical protein